MALIFTSRSPPTTKARHQRSTTVKAAFLDDFPHVAVEDAAIQLAHFLTES